LYGEFSVKPLRADILKFREGGKETSLKLSLAYVWSARVV
jgi:hypothetical protein